MKNITKRSFDLLFVSLAIIPALPIIAVSIFAIKINDLKAGRSTSSIYKQKRLGQHGKDFTIYKLRTMVPSKTGIDQLDSISDIHRVTRVGEILRKTKIDELPQLFNVLIGDMSIVGPRPNNSLESRTVVHDDTIRHKPGLTGDYQNISFEREVTLEERVKIESQYVFSVSNDLKIIWKTACLLKGAMLNIKAARDNSIDLAKSKNTIKSNVSDLYDDNEPDLTTAEVNGKNLLESRLASPS